MKTTTTYTPKHPGEAVQCFTSGTPDLRKDSPTGGAAPSRHRASLAAFRNFRELYRERKELAGLSAATVLALRGGQEDRCVGYLTVRTDLPPETYLEISFVRRSWRLLRLLADRNGDAVGEHPCWCPRKRDNPITWDIRRSIGMDPATARVNLRILIRILVTCGFLDRSSPGWISDVTATLVRHGSVGDYYRTLLFRMCNRCSWVFDDGFPPVPAIPVHALLLLWVLEHSPTGCTAFDLAGTLIAAERVSISTGCIPNGPSNTMSSNVLAAVLQARFLARTGSMLGLTESADIEGIFPENPVHRKYRTTPFARRILCWQM